VAIGARGEPEYGFACRPCPEPIGPGDDVEDPIEREFARRPAAAVMGIGCEQGLGRVRPTIAMIAVDENDAK
jgi:hypothetical protein